MAEHSKQRGREDLLADFQEASHELNEAARIADHWKHRNEDAYEVARRVANAHEIIVGLAKECCL